MLLSPVPRAHASVLFILTVCAVSAALAGIYKFLPPASASTSRETSAARPAIETSAPAPVSATIVVNSTADTTNTSDGLCTLREATTAANTDTASGATAGECAAGSGSDTIDLTGVTGTITLTTALPAIATDMTLTGPGASQLTVSGNNSVRVFYITLAGPGVVNFSGLTISNGLATMNVGGGIYNEHDATVNVSDSTISNNNAVLGGGLANSSNGPFTLTNCTVMNNSAGTAGGIYNGLGPFNVINSTLNNNTASGGSGNGGGINTGSGTLNVVNSTLSGNSAAGGGGAVYCNGIDGSISITNSTISNNSSSGDGGGINNSNGSAVGIINSIIALNSASSGPDLIGSFTSQGHNLIGKNDGSSGFTAGTSNPNGDLVGTVATPVNPMLAALANNGGPTQTRALLQGSTATDAGDNCVLTNSCTPVLASAITDDQRGTGFLRSLDGNGDGSATVDIGAFEVQSILVTNTADSGAGSLRQAIIDANASADSSAINFQPGLTGTISLSTALPDLSTSMAINGPGAGVLTVQRSTVGGTPQFSVFLITQTVSISGLTISNGLASPLVGGGGGIINRGTLTLLNVTVSANQTINGLPGGGIFNQGTLSIVNGIISGNASSASGDGGGIYNSGGTITMTNSTVSGNSSGSGVSTNGGGNGGGIWNGPSSVVSIINSVISGNHTGDGGGSANGGFGGGIYNIGTATITNSTISGNQTGGPNSAPGGGGGISNPGTLIVISCTISGNQTGNGSGAMNGYGTGGGIGNGGTASLRNTIVANNVVAGGAAGPDLFGTFNSQDFNLIENTTGATFTGTTTHNITGQDPQLGPLQNNGGPTLTHALLAGSPVLDAGNNCVFDNSCSPALASALTTDQRGAGFSRKADSADADTTATVDIGAFEAQASVEDIADKSMAEDTALSFGFNVGAAAAITNVTASSANTTLVPNLPANLSVTGSGSTRTLNITPAANQYGTSTITVTVTSGSQSMSDTFVLTVNPVADVPSVTAANTIVNTQTTSGLVISRNVVDDAEVTHFKITNITNGTLFKNDGTTQIGNNSFITFAEGNAGLRFTPATNLASPSSTFSFQVQGATSSVGAGLGPAAAAAITVDCGPTMVTNTNDSGPGSLRSVINSACPGSTITFNIPTSDPGFSGGVYNITLSSAELVINKNLTITGPGANVLTVRRSSAAGTPNFRIFTVASMMTASISGMTITNGRTADGVPAAVFGNPGDHGGGIMNSGLLTLTNMTVTGNRTGNGAVPSSPSSSGTAFGGPGGFGGGIYSSGHLTMSNVTVSNNTTGEGASAYYGGGGGRGGGIFVFSGSLTMTNCLVSGNVTGIGAIGTTNGASSGSGGGGGGIYIQVGTTTITNTSIINNTTGTTQVASPSNSGSGGEGGGITIVSGTSVDSGNTTIVNSAISGNRTGDGTGFSGQAGRGAGLNNGSSSNLTIIGTTISGNQTGNGVNGAEAGIGAGLSNTATTKIINSTISGNATGTGNSGAGAGIWNAKNLLLTNSTVVLNTGGTFGGPGIHQFNNSSAVTLRNTIIAGNTLSGQPNAADLSSGSPAYNSQGNNLIGNADGATGFSPANGDQLGTMATPLSPRLAPLGNYGGPTETHALLPGSPALDAGNNCVTEVAHCGDANVSQLTTDQRGFNRLVNSTVDIGSFESRGFTISATSGSPQSTTIGSTFGSPFVATVSSSFPEPVAGGVITFSAPTLGASGTFPGSVTSTTATADASGIATSPAFTANLISGSYNVIAGGKGISPPASFSLTNLKAASSTSVSSSVNPSDFGESVTFTATISTAVGLTPTGTVQFKDGATQLDSPVNCLGAPGNTCTAQLPISTLSVGDHNVSATYSGDGNLNGSSGSLSSNQVVKPVPTLSINDVTVTEGNSGTANLTFTVTLSAASNLTVSVKYDTADGMATVADNDYQLKTDTLTFTPGNRTKTVTVLVNGDHKTEPDETVFVVLSNPVNAAFGDSQGQGTILNDDDLQLLRDTSGPDANQLAALDSILLVRDPFPVLSVAEWWNLGADQNTRVIIFAANLTLNPDETASDVLVTLVDGNGQTPPDIAAEDVRALPDSNFTQIRFRLPNGLQAGNCLVTIKAQGRTSNTGSIRIAP